jgi:hypothetical protein
VIIEITKSCKMCVKIIIHVDKMEDNAFQRKSAKKLKFNGWRRKKGATAVTEDALLTC